MTMYNLRCLKCYFCFSKGVSQHHCNICWHGCKINKQLNKSKQIVWYNDTTVLIQKIMVYFDRILKSYVCLCRERIFIFCLRFLRLLGGITVNWMCKFMDPSVLDGSLNQYFSLFDKETASSYVSKIKIDHFTSLFIYHWRFFG